MKPIKLTMQAFGPYAGVETIDFAKLGNRTMFVISGKTGAGKTTIFDAISYAIYGKASGEDRNGPELRSQFAKDELLTEVSLDFSLRNKMYSITRSPQQQKKKEKGDGFTQIGAKGELYLIDDTGEKKLIASKVSDVDEKIKEIMLIDSNQFRQILMIPQGEFRKLLTSDSKDKEVILQRLFHTQIYKLVEERLKVEASELKKSVEDQVQARSEALRRIHAVLNEELHSFLDADSVNDTIMMPLLVEEITGMAERLAELDRTLKEKILEQDKLKAQVFEAEAILKQLQTKEQLKLQKTRLDEQAAVFSEKEIQVQKALKAVNLAHQEDLCHRLKRDLDQVQAAVNTITAELESLGQQSALCEQQLKKELDSEGERQAALEAANRLSSIKEDVYAFALLAKEAAELESNLKQANDNHHTAEKNLQSLEEQMKVLLEKKAEIERGQLIFLENKQKLSMLELELDRFDKYEKTNQQWQKARQNLTAVKGQYDNIVSRYSDARELVEELENKWRHGQAALLAAKLHSGEACPVCGSEHHPAPALFSEEEIPNEKDLKAAKEQVALLEQEKSKAELNYFEHLSAEKSQRETVEGIFAEMRAQRVDLTENNVRDVKLGIVSAKNQLVNQQRQLDEQIQQLDSIKMKIEKREADKLLLQNAIQDLTGEVSSLTVKFTEKNTNLTRMMNLIPENLRSAPEYERALASAKSLYEGLLKRLEDAKQRFQAVKEKHAAETARLQDAEKRFADKGKELDIEREVFKQQLSDHGFENYGDYASSKRSENEIQGLDQAIREYREELRSVTDRLTELTELLKDVKVPDVEGIKELLGNLVQEIESLTNQRTDLFVKKRDNEEIHNRVNHLNEQMKLLEERYKLIGHLYEIAKGQNTYRVTFERFVLAAFLDDILREANIRLRRMTSGRFHLSRKTDRSKGNAQSGLELLVFDQYTGQERHVKTLSGGESFKAALSLALGLADVVQNYAGGVSLETMFIDEGFGTLDPESLDQAIEALIDIQNSGRLVGIISHVPELKERIDVRLEVSAAQTGSRTEFVFSN